MRQKRQRFSERLALWLATIALIPTSGCGYQFAGESTFLPNNIRTVYIEPFINRSREVGVDKELASALKSAFYRRGQLKVVDEIEQADAILNGVVASLESHVASVNKYAEVLQFESVMVVDVTLRRREPAEIIWRGQGLRLSQLYSGQRGAVVTTSSAFQNGTLNASDVRQLTDIQLTEGESSGMRDRLIEQFAVELRQRLMEMF